MARREHRFIATDGRDKGKTFVITEMSAEQGESWGIRALLAIGAHADIPDDIAELGLQGLASLGLKELMKVPYEKLEPLLFEMMTCVRIEMPAATRTLIPDDIEEVSTRIKLRRAILEMHLDFSMAA